MSDYINHAARAMDPDAFADRNPQRPSAELQWAVRRKIATDHAEALDAVGMLATDGRGDRLEAMVERMASKAVEALDLHGDEPGLKSTRICRTCHVVQPCPTTLVLQADAVEAQQRHDAAVAARAWDEGHAAGVRNASAEFDGPVQDNPYKREGGASDG